MSGAIGLALVEYLGAEAHDGEGAIPEQLGGIIAYLVEVLDVVHFSQVVNFPFRPRRRLGNTPLRFLIIDAENFSIAFVVLRPVKNVNVIFVVHAFHFFVDY